MDAKRLAAYLAAVDRNLQGDAVLVIYGSAAFILLGETGRTSLDIDVAAPYSTVDYPDFERAAAEAGLSVNPDEACSDDHVEWIPAARLCLPRPDESTSLTLWQGRRLVVKTVSAPELVASKLVRYDATDEADVRFLVSQARMAYDEIAEAVERLPRGFRDDPVVRENLEGLRADMDLWRSTP